MDVYEQLYGWREINVIWIFKLMRRNCSYSVPVDRRMAALRYWEGPTSVISASNLLYLSISDSNSVKCGEASLNSFKVTSLSWMYRCS